MHSIQDDLERFREHISQLLADQLLRDSPIDWTTLAQLNKPVLRIQLSLQDEARHDPDHPMTTPIASVSLRGKKRRKKGLKLSMCI